MFRSPKYAARLNTLGRHHCTLHHHHHLDYSELQPHHQFSNELLSHQLPKLFQRHLSRQYDMVVYDCNQDDGPGRFR